METVTLSLFRFPTVAARIWVFGQMALARLDIRRTPDLLQWKLCGSGTGEGFTPVPNTSVWAILATWPNEEIARERVANAPVWKRWRARAAEDWTVFLAATSVRGKWAGTEPFHAVAEPGDGPLAALTRATVKPKVALKFWGQEPEISRAIGADPNVAFKIGIGELPWLQQVTFSIWPDKASMAEFARADGPHARAIKAVREGDWFREELYARFRILGDCGSWGGASPLKPLERQAA